MYTLYTYIHNADDYSGRNNRTYRRRGVMCGILYVTLYVPFRKCNIRVYDMAHASAVRAYVRDDGGRKVAY